MTNSANMPVKAHWDSYSCVRRASEYINTWESGSSDPWILIYCALELRFCLESVLLERFQNITGKDPKPKKQYLNSKRLVKDMLSVDSESMTEQKWILIPNAVSRKQSASAVPLEYKVINQGVVSGYIGRLDNLLHATIKYQKNVFVKKYWDKQLELLKQILEDIRLYNSGILAQPIKIRSSGNVSELPSK